MVALLAMAPLSSWLFYKLSYLNADMTNAIVAKQRDEYTRLFWFVTLVTGMMWLAQMVMDFLSSRLNVIWRQWLTDWMIMRYLRNRTYYDIAVREDLDNPDQRIQEDIEPFVSTMAAIPRRILSQLMGLATGGVIIASINPTMMWYVVGFAILSTIVTLVLYTPLIRLSFNSTVAEADLRYGILHVRDNAETVAFYRGEKTEHQQIRHRLSTAVKARLAIILYQLKMGTLNYGLGQLWTLAPFFLIAPLFFDGKIEYGDIAMATTAASQMLAALTTLTDFIPTVTDMAPSAVRLAQILERFDAMDEQQHQADQNKIEIKPGKRIALNDISLETPGGEQRLVRHLSLEVQPGRSLLIHGQTGVGKSSLLRAMAGLWQRGTGTITMPDKRDCFFLPQKPYMILSDLRSQLLYPHGDGSISDAELQRYLERVSLPTLVDKYGGLDEVRDWAKVLSLGEQQRIGFARVLVAKPQYVFLDEATSAVDIETESTLYCLLAEIGVTFISVGHRPSIMDYHADALCLYPSGQWDIKPITMLSQEEIGLIKTA
ncbi:ABC transporter ATP-binding protein/permease [Pectobacterium araliae]|uniref:ABC transporter ATP-binding protein/permease n=2 Tax=Pectobacterium araliae TaxID=3073862 RepID=A0AAN0MJ47_9GAMM|nr:ABC transporter ATP-binding protein/permease [Pectobacterium sp. MAFF 302110]